MKKCFGILLICLGLFSKIVMADSDEDIREILQTSKHHILIAATGGIPGDETFSYRVWNKPKNAEHGKPDLLIDNGTMWGPVSATDRACMKGARGYNFTLKNTSINIAVFDCPEKGQPKHAIGVLDVSINGKRRGRYWLYEVP